MDERFLAKTKPYKEDIQEHTDILLKNYEILKELYPNLYIDWELLFLACIYHDLGKMNHKFQKKLRGFSNEDEIPHGLISIGFIDTDYLEAKGYNEKEISLLYQAVAYHHDRKMPDSIEEVESEIENLRDIFSEFHYGKLLTKTINSNIDGVFFRLNKRFYESRDGDYFYRYVMLKGILNRLDYAASAHIEVEHRNDFLINSLEDLMQSWKNENPKACWNELQCYLRDHQNDNVVVIAQTGMGKTEGGLWWIGDNKGFFTLPLKSAINSIYHRIKNNIVKENIENRVGLLHSDTLKEYVEQENEDMSLMTYYDKTKQWSLPLTICTLDQIFNFVFRYKGFESKLATLSYSKIIIDEIQMYSPELVAYLILGLSYVIRLGGKFAVLTATLPQVILDLMKLQGIEFEEPVVFTNELIRHSVKVIDQLIDDKESIELMADRYNKNKILVICNTVRKAKTVYKLIKDCLSEEDKTKIHLLHSGFIGKDRNEKEDSIIKLGSNKCSDYGIWVTTQIVEASLDIDFDCLFTELSDLSGLFQRMGRCYRNRALDQEYNCYVFTGGNKKCSGVGPIIDEEIYALSKKNISRIDGILDEETKIQLINSVYTTENLKNSDFYKKTINTIDYVKSISSYELDKKEVIKRFRNINQVSVIPSCVFEAIEKDIYSWLKIINDNT